MLAVRRIRLDVLLLTVLTGLLLPAELPARRQSGASVRALIQQESLTRALDLLDREGGGSDSDRLFQKAYCLYRLEEWSPAAGLLQELISNGGATGMPGPLHPVEAESISPAGGSDHSTETDSDDVDAILRDYLLLFAATCLIGIEDFPSAERHLRLLLEQSDSLLRPAAEELLGQLSLRRGRPEEAIRIYGRLSAESSGRPERSRFQYQLARAHRQAGRTAEAAGVLKRIITDHPSSREALPALDDYRSLEDESPAGELLYRAGWVYFYSRQYDRAADAWDRFIKIQPRHELASRALFLGARAHFEDGRYKLARELCRRLWTDYPRSDRFTSSHFLMARCDEAEGLTEEAVERYHRFVEMYPWSQLADDALWRLARMAEREGDLDTAEREYWTLSQRYGSRKDASLALWRAGLYALYRGDSRTARSRLHRLMTGRDGGGYTDGALYWIARTYAADGDRHRAAVQMDTVIHRVGEGYYADLAGRWLKSSTQSQMDGGEQLTDLLAGMKTALPGDLPDHLHLRLRKGRQLIRMGLLPQARQELREVHQRAHDHPAVVEELFNLYQGYQLPGDALRLANSLRRHWPQDRIQQALQYYLYPLAYERLVQAEAENSQLDPFLILALMRTESLFDPLAESPAGARGLMQIMPATGREIASRLDVPDGDEINLLEPRWSIRMGVTYLDQQLQAYHGQIQFALAAYNAGPGNANRWLERLDGIDPDLFVELIDFRETRQFIRKVLAAQARYRKVWGHAG